VPRIPGSSPGRIVTGERLLIRGGTVVDGGGGEPFAADVLVDNRLIAGVGTAIRAEDCQVIDAEGLLVMPGFVDIHTHYDGQVTWENTLAPSTGHGVTTVVMGNCGVGFAPSVAASRGDLIRLMEGVEDIPEVVMTRGVPWAWETFPDYLDFLDGRSYDADIAAQLPHAALRVYVMRERGMVREPATRDDMLRMRDLTQEAIAAGALGFSTSRSVNHRTADGDPTPSYQVAEQELHAIASGAARAGRGVLQVMTDFPDLAQVPDRMRLLTDLTAGSGRPISFTLAQFHSSPRAWAAVLELTERAHADGLPIKGQVLPRPMGMVMTLETTRNPFFSSATFAALAESPLDERVGAMRKPAVRERILDEARAAPAKGLQRNFDFVFSLRTIDDYEPSTDQSVAALATARGVQPDVLAYDLLLEDDGRGVLWAGFANIIDGSLASTLTMMKSDATVIGLGDGGAHYGLIADASYPTFMLAYWGRDRTKGERLSVPYIVKSLARDPALAVGLNDRGLIAPGLKADLNVVDFAALQLSPPMIEYTLPSGGKRLMQSAAGYRATIVSGQITRRDGRATRALPGRLVRGSSAAV
jgi:N-acyl-D-amino-acid deacylase